MKKALFTSKNLIGDALYISLAWRAWWEKNKAEYDTVDLLTLDDHVKILYYGMGVPLRGMYYSTPGHLFEYDFQHTLDVSAAFKLSDEKGQHVAESYADLLGVEIERKPDRSHLVPFYQPPTRNEAVEAAIRNGEKQILFTDEHKGSILISMFSASCSSRKGERPNKMLPWPKWLPILKEIRKQFPDNPIRFLGAPTDMVPNGYAMNLVTAGEYMLGIPLDRLAHIMRESLFVLTLDNGMAHLAASQGAREFIFYPRVLGTHYILPFGNRNMKYIHMDPTSLNPAQAVWGLQQAWKEWGIV